MILWSGYWNPLDNQYFHPDELEAERLMKKYKGIRYDLTHDSSLSLEYRKRVDTEGRQLEDMLSRTPQWRRLVDRYDEAGRMVVERSKRKDSED